MSAREVARGARARPPASRPVSPALAAGVFAVALALRLLCLVQMRHDILFTHPVFDQSDYVEWARLIAASGYSEPQPYPRPPGLPYALAWIFRLAGDGLWVPRLVQALLSAAVCVLVFAIGRRWFTTRVALAAGLVTAVHGALIHAATEIMPTTWITFLDLLGLWLLGRWQARRSVAWVVSAGLVLGISALFLPTILLFVPVAAWAV